MGWDKWEEGLGQGKNKIHTIQSLVLLTDPLMIKWVRKHFLANKLV